MKIKDLEKYLNQTLGETVVFHKAGADQSLLPIIVSSRYQLYSARLYGQEIIFALTDKENTPLGYDKESKIIGRIIGKAVVLVIEDSSPLLIHRLVGRKVNFIIPGKRMFMPFVLIDLGGRVEHKAEGSIPPAAQLLLLYHLQINSLSGKDAAEVSKILSYPYLTISRAFKWLGDNLSLVRKEGRKMLLSFPEHKELLSKSKSFLRNPVLKRIITEEPLEGVDGIYCGEYALAHFSMLAENAVCKAVSKGNAPTLLEDARARNEVEIWMYDPKILAKNGYCDKISLILSLEGNEDERVQKELDRIKEEVSW